MSNSNINAAKGRRYTTKEKAEIIAFVDKVNAEKGRGGQSAASKKFKISPLTISSWIRSGIGGGSSISAGSAASVAGPMPPSGEVVRPKVTSPAALKRR